MSFRSSRATEVFRVALVMDRELFVGVDAIWQEYPGITHTYTIFR